MVVGRRRYVETKIGCTKCVGTEKLPLIRKLKFLASSIVIIIIGTVYFCIEDKEILDQLSRYSLQREPN